VAADGTQTSRPLPRAGFLFATPCLPATSASPGGEASRMVTSVPRDGQSALVAGGSARVFPSPAQPFTGR
jgi:hypothetical protein